MSSSLIVRYRTNVSPTDSRAAPHSPARARDDAHAKPANKTRRKHSFIDSHTRGSARAMSTSKYSGIAVAAANRAALARQEAEQERLNSGRRVDAKAEALLAHLRATMTSSAILGTNAERSKKTTRDDEDAAAARRRDAAVPPSTTTTTATPSSSSKKSKKRPHGDYHATVRAHPPSSDTVARDERDTDRAPEPPRTTKPKTYLSKAERKRLKKRARTDELASASSKP